MKPDGGPAFPFAYTAEQHVVDGMSLRDYFAGQALAGALASPRVLPVSTPNSYAAAAYEVADAMIAEREK